jgi:OOP family OmpA-OmpF porin
MRTRNLFMAAAVSVLVLLVSATGVFAENREGAFNVTVWMGGYNLDGDIPYDNGWTSGLSLGYNFTEKLGAELSFNYVESDYDGFPTVRGSTIDFNDADGEIYLGRLDMLYHVTGILPDMVVPYLAAGVGVSTYDTDQKGVDSDSNFNLNYGAGLKVFLTRNVALRGDVRHVIDFDGSDSYNNFLYAVGLCYEIGGKSKQAEVVAVEPEPAPAAPAPAPAPAVAPTPPPAAQQGAIIFRNIQFDLNKATLREESYPILDEVVDYLKANPSVKMEIQGHTCNLGSAAYNLKLSGQRAETVRKYLVGKGIAAERLTAKGYGLTKPIAPNDKEENRAKNRRVEFKPVQ